MSLCIPTVQAHMDNYSLFPEDDTAKRSRQSVCRTPAGVLSLSMGCDDAREAPLPSKRFSVSTIMCYAIACFATRLTLATDADVVEDMLVTAANFRRATATHSASDKTMADQRAHQVSIIDGDSTNNLLKALRGVTCAG